MKNISSVILSSLLSILLLMSLSFQVHAIHFDNDDHGVGHSVGDVSCISGHYSNDFKETLTLKMLVPISYLLVQKYQKTLFLLS